MSSDLLRPYDIFDPKAKVRNFRFLEDYENIRLNLLGTGKLWEDTKFIRHLGDDKEWLRPHEISRIPYFIDGHIRRQDALQGDLGDCWVISSMHALTFTHNISSYVIPEDQGFEDDRYIGAFRFRLWWMGDWFEVVVDDRLPVYKLHGATLRKMCFCHSKHYNVFWAALLEKAYCKFLDSDYPIDYDELDGGASTLAMRHFSGGIGETVLLDDPLPVVPPNASRDLKWYLLAHYNYRAWMTCTRGPERDRPFSEGIYPSHTYSVTKVVRLSDPEYQGLFLVRVMNPWGDAEFTGAWNDLDKDRWAIIEDSLKKKMDVVLDEHDGEFWMTEKDFASLFRALFINYLGPGHYMVGHLSMPQFIHWKTQYYEGEWVKGISDVGCDIKTRHKLPQCKFTLTQAQNDADKDGKCTVVMELICTNKLGRHQHTKLRVYVYSLSPALNPPKPLNYKYFQTVSPLNQINDHPGMVGAKSYHQSLELGAGEYCLIPCTETPDFHERFLLRVFSESIVNLWEYDAAIGKAAPMEENTQTESDTSLRRQFDDIAQRQDEIDWSGLKKLLYELMNPDKSVFGIISSFFTNFLVLLKSYINSSTDDDIGDVAFTKDQCRQMIAMLDDNHSGEISFSEFEKLWKKICFWSEVYKQYSDEEEGYFKVSQLRDALGSIGYNINRRTVHSLGYVYADDEGHIKLTDFILCGVALETTLTLHQRISGGKDESKTTFTLEEWVKNTLIL